MPSLARLLVAFVVAVAVVGCGYHVGLRFEAPLPARLSRMRDALGGGVDGGIVYLRYAIDGPDGAWTYEMIASPETYAERRTRESDGARHTFGADADGPWLRVGDGEPVAVDDDWEELSRTRAGFFGLGFLAPRPNDATVVMSQARDAWELAYTPAGGRTITLTIDRDSDLPRAWDVVDRYDRIAVCDDLAWDRRGGRPVLASARCASILNEKGRVETTMRLEAAEPMSIDERPAWALPPTGARRPPPLLDTAELPMPDPTEPRLPVRIGDRAPVDFVLDSGAFTTVVAGRVARALGIVPTGEAPFWILPAWLREGRHWVGVADRIRIGPVEIHGARVLVMEDDAGLGDCAGLLGADFFDRYVVDVDAPGGAIRIAERERWALPAGGARVHLVGSPSGGLRIPGEVTDVAEGPIVLDTGASLDAVVSAWQMRVKHPRKRGTDAFLKQGEMSSSPDYETQIDGLRLGPFAFPKMDAYGRDRERERLGGAIALVGMGILRHLRVAFDVRDRYVFLWPGPSYVVLRRVGIEIDDRARRPTVTRVVEGASAGGKIRVDDVVVSVNGKRVGDARAAHAAIAAAKGDRVRIGIVRRGWRRVVVVAAPS